MTTPINLPMNNRSPTPGICQGMGIAIAISLVLMLLTPAANAQRPSIAQLQADIAALQANQVPGLSTYLQVDDTTDPTRPVVLVDGANLQVVNGTGLISMTNGVGNLIVGYDTAATGNFYCSDGQYQDQLNCETFGGTWAQSHKSGSHNIVVGHGNSFSSFGGIVGPLDNTISGAFASVTGGELNQATGKGASVIGGLSRR